MDTNNSPSQRETVARLLLDCGCVQVRAEEPFRLPSGWASPVYMDCRRLISFPAARAELMRMGLEMLKQRGCLEALDSIAGAEASGIAFAAWMAEALGLPLQYVRKQTRGIGLGSQLVGVTPPGSRVLLVDDLMAGGTSKVNFIRAINSAGARVKDLFVIFDYGTFPTAGMLAPLGVAVHSLARWADVLAAGNSSGQFDANAVAEIGAFLASPAGWSAAHGGVSGVRPPL